MKRIHGNKSETEIPQNIDGSRIGKNYKKIAIYILIMLQATEENNRMVITISKRLLKEI